MSLDQRRALITGASSGIGKATALAFAKAGIDVALVRRSLHKLETVAQLAGELKILLPCSLLPAPLPLLVTAICPGAC